MRKKFWFLPVATAVMAAASALVRRWHLKTAFEPETGLMIPDCLSTYLLVGLVAAGALAFLWLAWRSEGTYPNSYLHSFHAPHPLALAAGLMAAVLLVAAGCLGIMGYISHSHRQLSRLALGAALLPCGLCVAEITRRNFVGDTRRGRLSALLLAPGYCGCLWLLQAYQSHTANPVILDYVFLLLGIVAATLAVYYQASFSFEGPRPRRAKFFSAVAVELLVVGMVHFEDRMTTLLAAGMALYLFTQLTVLCYRGERPSPLPPLEPPAPEEGPAETEGENDRKDEVDRDE